MEFTALSVSSKMFSSLLIIICSASVATAAAVAAVNGDQQQKHVATFYSSIDRSPGSPQVYRYSNEDDEGMPPSIYEQPESTLKIFRPDDTVDLPCAASGSPRPSYSWLFNGHALDLTQFERLKHGSIRINPVRIFHEGYYQCVASNDHGVALSTVVFLQRAALHYYQSTDAREYRVRQGHRLHVECNAPRSVPNATYSWSLARDVDSYPRPVVVGSRVQIDAQGDLYFAHVDLSDMNKDGYLYKCSVFNPYLDLTTTGGYSVIHVLPASGTFQQKPAILFSSTAVVALENTAVSLRCFFSGLPEPTVEWRRSGKRWTEGRHKITSFKTEVVINDVQPSDEGVYICKGTNSVGESEQTIYVDVQARPEFKTIVDKPHDVNVTTGDSVTINCSAYGEPPPAVTWYRNGRPLHSSNLTSNFHIGHDGLTLTIKQLCKRTPFGEEDESCVPKPENGPTVIQCNASNEHGYTFANGYINILERTAIDGNSFDQKLELYQDVVFDCPATTDPSTELKRSWYYKKGLVVEDDHIYVAENGSLVILMSQDDDGGVSRIGTYRCHVTNGYSDSEIAIDLYSSTTSPIVNTVTRATIFDWWWLLIIGLAALILLLLFIAVIVCIAHGRQSGIYRDLTVTEEAVDTLERKNGHNPEKDLADQYFKEYTESPNSAANKDDYSTATMSLLRAYPAARLNETNTSSLRSDYSLLDDRRFNEDGSFIGQYATIDKNGTVRNGGIQSMQATL